MLDLTKPLTPQNRILLTDALAASHGKPADGKLPPDPLKGRLRSALAEAQLQSWVQQIDGRQRPIPSYLWAGSVFWDAASFTLSVSVLLDDDRIEGFVLLDRDEFHRWLNQASVDEKTNVPVECTAGGLDALPYLKYMLEIVDVLNLRKEKLAKRSILQEEIRHRWPKGLKFSNHKVRAIATLLSDPEGEKGGNRPRSA